MSVRTLIRVLFLVVMLASIVVGEKPPPGMRIERPPPHGASAEGLSRLQEWRQLYSARLAAVRRSAQVLFSELEQSSLATLGDRCRSLVAQVGEVDRRGLFRSGDEQLDRMLYGSLERYREGAAECLAGRYLVAYRLLVEAHAGFEWVDRRVDRRLRPSVRLPGLDPPR